jgi:isopenicillin N synthase-like dioxygenase
MPHGQLSYPRSEDEEAKTKNVWLKGHTGRSWIIFSDHHLNWWLQDFGTITILYSQPVAALQILTPEGTWKWVKHLENSLVGPIR